MQSLMQHMLFKNKCWVLSVLNVAKQTTFQHAAIYIV
jgi:hypothetical protein